MQIASASVRPGARALSRVPGARPPERAPEWRARSATRKCGEPPVRGCTTAAAKNSETTLKSTRLELGSSLQAVLSSSLSLPADLCSVVSRLAFACARVSTLLRSGPSPGAPSPLGGRNAFGDTQIAADVAADEILFEALRGHCSFAASEERPEGVREGPSGSFAVAFDPLDGSSIAQSNLAVGTIAGVWRGDDVCGKTGRELSAAVVALYGPRTTLWVAVAGRERTSGLNAAESERTGARSGDAVGCGGKGGTPVAEMLEAGGTATLASAASPARAVAPIPALPPHAIPLLPPGPDVSVGALEFSLAADPETGATAVSGEVPVFLLSSVTRGMSPHALSFSPGNLGGAWSSPETRSLVEVCLSRRLKLRYSGGMVPDVLQSLTSSSGVFFHAPAPEQASKLRLAFEIAPLAFLTEAAGGLSRSFGAPSGAAFGPYEAGSALDIPCTSLEQVADVCLGSREEIELYAVLLAGRS